MSAGKHGRRRPINRLHTAEAEAKARPTPRSRPRL